MDKTCPHNLTLSGYQIKENVLAGIDYMEMTKAYRILVGKLEVKRCLGELDLMREWY
jgi:hypothetical protein